MLTFLGLLLATVHLITSFMAGPVEVTCFCAQVTALAFLCAMDFLLAVLAGDSPALGCYMSRFVSVTTHPGMSGIHHKSSVPSNSTPEPGTLTLLSGEAEVHLLLLQPHLLYPLWLDQVQTEQSFR